MDVRSFNVSHFVKAEPLDKLFFFSKKVSAYLNVFHRKENFKHDEQKGLNICLKANMSIYFFLCYLYKFVFHFALNGFCYNNYTTLLYNILSSFFGFI